MARIHQDWLKSFCDFAAFGEAPPHVYYWVGVSTLAGALQRRVYIDQYFFRWYPNHYIILVAPPGEISKTTTAGIGMKLLKQVPQIHFGPNVVTWPALVKFFGTCIEEFELEGKIAQQAALTISSSELGNLLNPSDRDMVDMLVTLWDGEDIKKMTKASGNDDVPNPLLNLIACTTPSWISSSIPEYMLGGGLLSRCLFVHADQKHNFIAYPGLHMPRDMNAQADLLVKDLEGISKMAGEFALTQDAVEWGEEWYMNLTQERKTADSRIRDFMARKQTHVHKLAMILSVSRRETLVIEKEDLMDAATEITKLEARMLGVFNQIGKSSDATASDFLMEQLTRKGKTSSQEAYRLMRTQFPKYSDFQNMLNGLISAGMVSSTFEGGAQFLTPVK